MTDSELKAYHKYFSDGLYLLKNWEQVQISHITQMIKSHDDVIMNRIFCLVTKCEIMDLKNEKVKIEKLQYQEMIYQSWILFKKYSEPNESEQFWDTFVSDILVQLNNFNHCHFINRILIYVVLEFIEKKFMSGKQIFSELIVS